MQKILVWVDVMGVGNKVFLLGTRLIRTDLVKMVPWMIMWSHFCLTKKQALMSLYSVASHEVYHDTIWMSLKVFISLLFL